MDAQFFLYSLNEDIFRKKLRIFSKAEKTYLLESLQRFYDFFSDISLTITTKFFLLICQRQKFAPVLGIRISMLLGLPDPDLLVRGMDPDPDPSLFP